MSNINIEKPYYFISSTNVDDEHVLPVIAFLNENKINTWYDGSIMGGAEWIDSTMNAIDDSQGVIAFISINYNESKRCNRELHMANDELNKKIIPVYVSDTALSSDLKHIVNGKDILYKYKLTDRKFHTDLLAIIAGVNVAPITMAQVKPSSNEEKFAKAMALVNGNKAASAAATLKELSDIGYHQATCSLANMYLTGVGVDKNLKKALELHTIASDKKIVKSLYALGKMYLDGVGVKADRDKALTYFDRAASLGDSNTAMTLADWYSEGTNAPKDPKKALQYYEVCASRGVSDGMYCAGMAYYYGNGVERNFPRAFEYFTKAAKANNADALYMTALCYIEGNGVEQDIPHAISLLEQLATDSDVKAGGLLSDAYVEIGDYARAFTHLLRAKESGDATAALKVASCYREGKGVALDQSKAIEIYTKLAESGNISAQVELAICQFFGEGMARDMKKAFKLMTKLEKSSQAAEVYYALGLFYTQEEFSKTNIEKSYKYFEQAATLGDTRAKCALGKLLLSGAHGEIDNVKVYNLFNAAASPSAPEAYYYLGRCYYHALGVAQDYDLAYKNLRKAAIFKIPYGANLLGLCYYYARGVTQNFDLAYSNFLTAFRNCDKAGACNASLCALLGKGTNENTERAIKALSANINSSVECLFALAECYALGYGVDTDIAKAESMYLQAAGYSYPPALRALSDIYKNGGVTLKKSSSKSAKYAQDAEHSSYLVESILLNQN